MVLYNFAVFVNHELHTLQDELENTTRPMQKARITFAMRFIGL